MSDLPALPNPSGDVTITLTPTEWLRLCIVIKVMRDEARTNAAAGILAELGLKILDQVQPTLANAALAATLREVVA